MHQTTTEIIARALRRIGVAAADEPPTGDQMQSGLDAINEIGSSFRLHGVMFDMPWMGANSTLPFDAPCLLPFQTVLAARLAEEYGVPGPDPSEGWRQLAAYYYVMPESDISELSATDSQRRVVRPKC